MPCTDGGVPYRDEGPDLEAYLCAVLRAVEAQVLLSKVLAKIDEPKAGVTIKEITAWWRDHKALDDQRLLDEARDRRREADRRRAAEKLTAAERELLGISL